MTMNIRFKSKHRLLQLIAVALLFLGCSVSGMTEETSIKKEGLVKKGDFGKPPYKSVEEIKREISYLSKMLLEVTGEDEYKIEASAYVRPFIGGCFDQKPEGVLITCITPGYQAEKAGVQTGDLLLAINDESMALKADKDKKAEKGRFFDIVRSMKTNDKLRLTLLRSGEKRTIDLVVGSVIHPAYSLQVKK